MGHDSPQVGLEDAEHVCLNPTMGILSQHPQSHPSRSFAKIGITKNGRKQHKLQKRSLVGFRWGGGGVGTWCWFACLWRRLLASTLCGSERVLVVSTEPLDDLSWLTTLGSAVPETGCCPCC